MKAFQPFTMVSILSILLSTVGCGPVSTPVAIDPSTTNPPRNESSPPAKTPESAPATQPVVEDTPYTIAEVEELAGFDVQEPAYLPSGVSFDFATYQESPGPFTVLHFKIVHEQYGDMGAFFQIMQEPQTEAPPDTVSCGEVSRGCEVLQIGNIPVIYRWQPAGPEELDWYADGFAFRLHRTAGEPNKIYKDELMNVAGSLE